MTAQLNILTQASSPISPQDPLILKLLRHSAGVAFIQIIDFLS